MTGEEFLDVLARLRCAPVGRARLRAPHKPLLLLWLFGRFAAAGSTAAAYAEAEEPVSTLINDFGPPVASASAGRQRAAMPFVHLERDLGPAGRRDRGRPWWRVRVRVRVRARARGGPGWAGAASMRTKSRSIRGRRTACTQSVCPVQAALDKGSCLVKLGPAGYR